jgi:dTDP-4-amino-4,6-dideoxy-D-galactose acyltransferase
MTGWELRPWDSEFFGARIAQITVNRATSDELAAVVTQAGEEAVDCLYFLADAEDVGTLRAAETNGFELMDVRVTLERRLVRGESHREGLTGVPVVRSVRDDDVAVLKAIARVSHRNTRFSVDARFAGTRADELYALWIERSARGELADAVHVVDVEGSARGYITLSSGAGGATIGLVAVDAAFQGRGYGERLLCSGLQWAMEKGLDRVSVVTQGRSAASLRFYERVGFTTRLVQLWYHRWREVGRSRA